MKQKLFFILLIITIKAILATNTKHFNVILESTWQNLENNKNKSKSLDDKLILVGTITFKKKESIESVYLNHLELIWQGKKINNITSSLYKKNLDPDKKDFIPIEDYLVCDGTWNKKKQTLILHFDHKYTLGPINTFYLVFMVPNELEKSLQNGSFCIEKQSLPDRLKQSVQNDSLALEFKNIQKKVTYTAHKHIK